MPSCESMVFIGKGSKFRPCQITYNPPKFASKGIYEVTGLQDARNGNSYDVAVACMNNDMQMLINTAIAKKMDPEEPIPKIKKKKPHAPSSESTPDFGI